MSTAALSSSVFILLTGTRSGGLRIVPRGGIAVVAASAGVGSLGSALGAMASGALRRAFEAKEKKSSKD